MKRKAVTILAAGMMFCSLALAACGGAGDAQQTAQTQESAAQKDGAESGDSADAQAADETGADAVSDQEAADKAAALIDAIYVQKRTEETDEQCAQAKAAWDALTDAQKELVSGEFADSDYFGRDTGDASLDDPRNQERMRSWWSVSALLLMTVVSVISKGLRTPLLRPILTGLSEGLLPRRSSSTTYRRATANLSTTWIRLWSARRQTA